MDEDLQQMTREELIDEVKKLRQGIRRHRDSSLHERKDGVTERLTAAGLTAAHVVETETGFCVLAIKPDRM